MSKFAWEPQDRLLFGTREEWFALRAENERLREHLGIVLGFINRRTLVTVICEDVEDVMDALDAAESLLAALEQP